MSTSNLNQRATFQHCDNHLGFKQNYRVVSTTTDSRGAYSVTWTPDIPGDYKIAAYFEGTNGYWPSNSATTFNIVTAQETTQPTQTEMPQTLVDQYFLAAVAAIIASIFVVGAILALMLKKRP